MHVIAVLNQKGGAGKTTIATHLARALQIGGADVLLIDSDPQGSARDWAAVREDQPVSVVGLDRPTIERDLKNVARKDFVVIDGAPQAADLAVSAIKAANFILIPVWRLTKAISPSNLRSRKYTPMATGLIRLRSHSAR